MKATKCLLAMVLVLGLILGLCACSEAGNDNSSDPSGTESQPVESNGATDDTGETKVPTYTVKVVDEGNNPIANAVVQLCVESNCYPSATNAEGVAEFFVEENEYKVSFVVMPAGYTYPTEEENFYFDAGANALTITLKAVS